MPLVDVPVNLRQWERREVAMELRFSYCSGGVTYVGTGRTRNLGGETVCFEADQNLRQNSDLELRIPWPFELQSVCPLELVVRGPLLRKNNDVAVIRIDNYEFQTHGDRSFSQLASCGVTCDLVM